MVYEYQITEEMIRCFNSCVKEKNYKPFVSSYSYGMYKTIDIIKIVSFSDRKTFFITQNLRRFLRYLENFNYRNPNEDVKGVYNSDIGGLGIEICSDIKDAIMTMNWDDFYRKYRSTADHIINESRKQKIADICIQFGNRCWKNFSARDDVANNRYSDVESNHCHSCKTSTQTVLVSSKNSMGMFKKNNNSIISPSMMVQPRITSSTGYSSKQQNISEPNGSILSGSNYLGNQSLYNQQDEIQESYQSVYQSTYPYRFPNNEVEFYSGSNDGRSATQSSRLHSGSTKSDYHGYPVSSPNKTSSSNYDDNENSMPSRRDDNSYRVSRSNGNIMTPVTSEDNAKMDNSYNCSDGATPKISSSSGNSHIGEKLAARTIDEENRDVLSSRNLESSRTQVKARGVSQLHNTKFSSLVDTSCHSRVNGNHQKHLYQTRDSTEILRPNENEITTQPEQFIGTIVDYNCQGHTFQSATLKQQFYGKAEQTGSCFERSNPSPTDDYSLLRDKDDEETMMRRSSSFEKIDASELNDEAHGMDPKTSMEIHFPVDDRASVTSNDTCFNLDEFQKNSIRRQDSVNEIYDNQIKNYQQDIDFQTDEIASKNSRVTRDFQKYQDEEWITIRNDDPVDSMEDDDNAAFNAKLQEIKDQQAEELRQKREERRKKQNELEDELRTMRNESRERFRMFMKCIILKQRFEDQEQYWSDWIWDSKTNIIALLKFFSMFEHEFRKICYSSKKVDQEDLEDFLREKNLLAKRVMDTFDAMEYSFTTLKNIEEYYSDAMFLKVLQKCLSDMGNLLLEIYENVCDLKSNRNSFEKLDEEMSKLKTDLIYSTSELRKVCKAGDLFGQYQNVEFPKIESNVIVEEMN